MRAGLARRTTGGVLTEPTDTCFAPLDALLADVTGTGTGRVPRERWVDVLLDVYNSATSTAVRDLVGESIVDAAAATTVDATGGREAAALVVAAHAAESASRPVVRGPGRLRRAGTVAPWTIRGRRA